jgi:hypothetical protein
MKNLSKKNFTTFTLDNKHIINNQKAKQFLFIFIFTQIKNKIFAQAFLFLYANFLNLAL